jgi:hypothetical protein
MATMSDIFKAGSSIRENCRCRTSVNGLVNEKGIATFNCPICHNQWSYSVRSNAKGKGSRFSSEDLTNLLKTRSISVNSIVG